MHVFMIQIKCCLADSVSPHSVSVPCKWGTWGEERWCSVFAFLPISSSSFDFCKYLARNHISCQRQELYFVFNYNPSQSQAGQWAIEHIWSTTEVSIQPIHLNWLVNFCTRNIEHQASSYRIVIVGTTMMNWRLILAGRKPVGHYSAIHPPLHGLL